MSKALTFLEDVKIWGDQITSVNDDALLNRLILQASRAIHAYLSVNNLFYSNFVEVYNGLNNTRIFLKEYPIVSVDYLYVNGILINEAPQPPNLGYGWRLEKPNNAPPARPQAIDLYGATFAKGSQNVYISYWAGYCVQSEKHIIPSIAPYNITTNQPYGAWAQDDGLFDINGNKFTHVYNDPDVNQYSIDASSGVYKFNASNANTQVFINYSYVPFDIEQACIEMVRERYSYSKRIGQKSKSLGGTEKISYDLSAMSDYVKMLLQPYRRTSTS